MLFPAVNNPTISANGLNHELKVISQWVYQWKMNFNPDLNKQATELLFSCKQNSPNHPSIFFNESVVLKVKEQKHLGLTLDPKLSFERHVNEKIIKAKKGIGIIKYISKFLPIKTLDQMYKALVRSHLDYCDTIYHIPTKLLQLLLLHGRVQIAPNFTKNWDGRHSLTVVGTGAFSRYTKLKSTRPLLTLETNYLHTVDPCINLIPYRLKVHLPKFWSSDESFDRRSKVPRKI